MNYSYARSFTAGHLWTLAVEEQFYLIWPLTLGLLGRRWSASLLIGVMFVDPVLRMLSPYVGSAFEFVINADTLGIGCLLALWQPQLEINSKYREFLASQWFGVITFVAIAANYLPSTKLMWLVGQPITNVGIVLVVHWVIRNPPGRITRFLNYPAMTFMGILSYSIYLWQQLFTYGLHNSLSAFPLNIVLMFSAALGSYFLIEGPCLRLRRRLEETLLGSKPLRIPQKIRENNPGTDGFSPAVR